MEAGYQKPGSAGYMLPGSACILPSHGRHFYFRYARNEKYADTIHDCDERFHGGVYRAAALFGRNLWQRCEKGL